MVNSSFLKHKPSAKTLFKFLLLLGVLVTYFLFLSWKYGFATGGIVSALTWSFFVLCTPIADAGFLLDFPVRLITHVKMIFSEIMVWVIAIVLNLWAINFHSDYYDKTALTQLFYKILMNPLPYWSIIFLSSIGTFISIYFGDEVIDSVGKKTSVKLSKKHKTIKLFATIILFVFIVVVYYHLLSSLGVSLDNLS